MENSQQDPKPNVGTSQEQQTQLILNGGIALTAFFAFTALFGKDQILSGLFSALYVGLSVGVAYWGMKFVYDLYLTVVQKKGNSEVSDAILQWMYAKKAGVSQDQNVNREQMEEYLRWKIQQEQQQQSAG